RAVRVLHVRPPQEMRDRYTAFVRKEGAHHEALGELIGDEHRERCEPEPLHKVGVGMNCEKKLATCENQPKKATQPVATSSAPAPNSIGVKKRLMRCIAESEKLIAAAATKNGSASP